MHCDLYADVSGVVVDAGVFTSEEGHRYPVGTDAFYANITYFDGEQINLQQGAPYSKSVEVPLVQ